MVRLAEVRARAQRRTSNLYDTWFTRRVSAYITLALIPLGASPNTVSAVNVGVGAAVCGLVAFGPGAWPGIGALLIHLYAVLDSVDGELARWFKKGSLRGIFLENWSAYMMMAAFPIAVALHLRHLGQGDGPLILAVVYAALARNAMPVVRRVALGVMQESPAYARSEIEKLSRDVGGGGRVAALRLLLEKTILYQTNVWIWLSALIAAGTWLEPRAAWVELGAFCFFYGGLVLKEIAIVVIVLRTPHIADQMKRAYGEASREPPAPISDKNQTPII